MEIQFGATVVDKNDELLGTVDHLMRNTLTGEINKFVVNRKSPHKDLFFTPGDVLSERDNQLKVDFSLSEQSSN